MEVPGHAVGEEANARGDISSVDRSQHRHFTCRTGNAHAAAGVANVVCRTDACAARFGVLYHLDVIFVVASVIIIGNAVSGQFCLH